MKRWSGVWESHVEVDMALLFVPRRPSSPHHHPLIRPQLPSPRGQTRNNSVLQMDGRVTSPFSEFTTLPHPEALPAFSRILLRDGQLAIRRHSAGRREPPFPRSVPPQTSQTAALAGELRQTRRSMAASDAPSSWKLLRGAVVAREVRVHQ